MRKIGQTSAHTGNPVTQSVHVGVWWIVGHQKLTIRTRLLGVVRTSFINTAGPSWLLKGSSILNSRALGD